ASSPALLLPEKGASVQVVLFVLNTKYFAAGFGSSPRGEAGVRPPLHRMHQDNPSSRITYIGTHNSLSMLTSIKSLIISLFLCLLSNLMSAQLRVANVFTSNMVLQRDQPIAIWGTTRPSVMVAVHFAGQEVAAKADATGKWSLQLKALPASATPEKLEIYSDTSVISLHNVLVGDVWLCSGQSNMEYPLDRSLKRHAAPGKGTDLAKAEVANTNRPDGIRYLYADRVLNKYPNLPTKGWATGNDTIVNYVSAIGYFFAKELFEKTGIPIGIISSSWGGTRIEPWTQPAAYKTSKIFESVAVGDTFKIDGSKTGQMFKGMIEPLVPMTIKGVLWYQGESNCMIEDQDTYKEKMRLLENNWRDVFHSPKLPFYTVQISPYLYTARKDPKPHSPELLAQFWEAQTQCMELPNTHMVVTTDLVDNLKDIHPSYKWIVAHRLAIQALYTEYNLHEMVVNSPAFKSLKRKKDQLVLSFENIGTGLQSSDGKALSWFTIAGKDKVFVPAEAAVVNDKVVVSAASISKPKYVRFAWNETAMPNLVSKEGLPCIPFRSDRD
ncbi:MAG: sialate O-acetylesterase, partial [Chitinophagaceae bacterium]